MGMWQLVYDLGGYYEMHFNGEYSKEDAAHIIIEADDFILSAIDGNGQWMSLECSNEPDFMMTIHICSLDEV